MMRTHRAALGGFAVFAAVSAFAGRAESRSLQVLHAFCASTQDNCSDGAYPSGLVRDKAGNLFGITELGGSSGQGTVFEMSRDPASGDWTYRVIYQFCAKGDCTESPVSSLIVDTAGNLYGTTYNTYYGAGYGGVYRLSPNRNGTKWRHTVLHQFDQNGYMSESALTYAGASSGLPYDGASPLYGASALGGDKEAGNIYALTPQSGGWQYAIIHSFCESDCSDGKAPFATPMMDAAGDLYGATSEGGHADQGVAYKLAHGDWNETVLYNFCSAANCADGAVPSSLIMDATGNLFGTTGRGGACSEAIGCGVAFKLTPDGQESVLYDFCGKRDCGDGSLPAGTLYLGRNGKLYGATQIGGGNDTDIAGLGGGTVFEIGKVHRVLYRFCAQASCADGAYPSSRLIADGQGGFFGLTMRGGANGYGTVFEITP